MSTPSVADVDRAPVTRSGSLRADSSVHFQSTPAARESAFVAVRPEPSMGPVRSTDGRKQRPAGLLPMQVGGMFPLVLRDKPQERISPQALSKMRAELRVAEARSRRAESTVTSAAMEKGQDSPEAREALKALDAATVAVMAIRRTLADAEATAKGRPTQVRLETAHDPAECQDALADTDRPSVFVCMHDGCKGVEWENEQAMRAAHPTHAEMARTMQAHVFCLLSHAPADPLDPDGPILGYIAPVGRDGTTVRETLAAVDERADEDALRDRVASLESRLADALALIEAHAKPGKKP